MAYEIPLTIFEVVQDVSVTGISFLPSKGSSHGALPK